eukprot:CAMPEP_0117424148 /NCGR_PEP_ID=MMETSP0758-20121206/4622_1 /TAXON_ID=63605 /ORGANISM="Percolomonas cosmopolitus, Strain AE-1 (ATCC 50343)" /LENGTH=853 /DNA_ID=CAMNT_0005207747 /DNA_START=74 /DNA_END=2632 /DNA_ORIENTATION=+
MFPYAQGDGAERIDALLQPQIQLQIAQESFLNQIETNYRDIQEQYRKKRIEALQQTEKQILNLEQARQQAREKFDAEMQMKQTLTRRQMELQLLTEQNKKEEMDRYMRRKVALEEEKMREQQFHMVSQEAQQSFRRELENEQSRHSQMMTSVYQKQLKDIYQAPSPQKPRYEPPQQQHYQPQPQPHQPQTHQPQQHQPQQHQPQQRQQQEPYQKPPRPEPEYNSYRTKPTPNSRPHTGEYQPPKEVTPQTPSSDEPYMPSGNMHTPQQESTKPTQNRSARLIDPSQMIPDDDSYYNDGYSTLNDSDQPPSRPRPKRKPLSEEPPSPIQTLEESVQDESPVVDDDEEEFGEEQKKTSEEEEETIEDIIDDIETADIDDGVDDDMYSMPVTTNIFSKLHQPPSSQPKTSTIKKEKVNTVVLDESSASTTHLKSSEDSPLVIPLDPSDVEQKEKVDKTPVVVVDEKKEVKKKGFFSRFLGKKRDHNESDEEKVASETEYATERDSEAPAADEKLAARDFRREVSRMYMSTKICPAFETLLKHIEGKCSSKSKMKKENVYHKRANQLRSVLESYDGDARKRVLQDAVIGHVGDHDTDVIGAIAVDMVRYLPNSLLSALRARRILDSQQDWPLDKLNELLIHKKQQQGMWNALISHLKRLEKIDKYAMRPIYEVYSSAIVPHRSLQIHGFSGSDALASDSEASNSYDYMKEQVMDYLQFLVRGKHKRRRSITNLFSSGKKKPSPSTSPQKKKTSTLSIQQQEQDDPSKVPSSATPSSRPSSSSSVILGMGRRSYGGGASSSLFTNRFNAMNMSSSTNASSGTDWNELVMGGSSSSSTRPKTSLFNSNKSSMFQASNNN